MSLSEVPHPDARPLGPDEALAIVDEMRSSCGSFSRAQWKWMYDELAKLRTYLAAPQPGAGPGEPLLAAINKACDIIELGDERLLAGDGPAGGQPPELSLAEWRKLYVTLDKARKAAAFPTGAGPVAGRDAEKLPVCTRCHAFIASRGELCQWCAESNEGHTP